MFDGRRSVFESAPVAAKSIAKYLRSIGETAIGGKAIGEKAVPEKQCRKTLTKSFKERGF
jgi:hypothetical protein